MAASLLYMLCMLHQLWLCVSCARFHEKKGTRMGVNVPLVRYSTNSLAGIGRDQLT